MAGILSSFRFGGIEELARDTSFYRHESNLGTHTTDARNIGVASPTRRVFALMHGVHSTQDRNITAVTIGGISATIHAQINAAQSSGDANVCGIASAIVPTGNTAIVSATFQNIIGKFSCAVIALDKLLNSTPFDTLTADGNASNIVSGVLDLASGGYAMAIMGAQDSTLTVNPPVVWDAPMEQYLTEWWFEEGDSGDDYEPTSLARAYPTNAQTNAGIVATNDASINDDLAMVALSWR